MTYSAHSFKNGISNSVFTRVLIAVFAIVVVGCDSATDTPEDQPAVISPAAFDLADALFPTNTMAQSAADKSEVNPKTHWTNAAVRVGVVSTAIGLNLILPTAATGAALSEAPSIDQGTWIWTSSVDVANQQVTFELEGTPDGQSVDWSMFVTTSAPFLGQDYDRFELYDARTAFDGQSGDYNLYYRVDGTRTLVLDATFNITQSGNVGSSESTRELDFSVPSGLDHGGDTALYTFDGTTRTLDWHDDSEAQNSLMQWDATDQSGSILADDYNNGDLACWDADLEDIACTTTVSAKLISLEN